MKIKTSQEMFDALVEKNASSERILEVMMKRADRHLEYYQSAKKQLLKLKAEHRNLLFSTGRLITVTVDHMAQDNYGAYVWYKNSMYRYEGDGIWKKYPNKNNQCPHHMARHIHSKFKVNLLLSDEDMPEVFIGKCTGNVLGKKIIMADGHMIGYGDEFELRKVKNG
uniref:Uncharacterized protein n=1 Tax=Salmonella phage vB_SEnST11_KE23 TaxID=3161174 RepID=A0AAU8GES3_9CAUD